MNHFHFKFKTLLFLAILFILPFSSCEKEQDTRNPLGEDIPLKGRLIFNANFPNDVISVTNFHEDIILEEAKRFEFESINTVIAYNETRDEIVYIGYPGRIESTNYELGARETALFLSMKVIPYIHSPENRSAMLELKNILYDEVEEIHTLSNKIEYSIQQKGYLDISLFQAEWESAMQAIIDLFDLDAENPIGKSDIATGDRYEMQVKYPENDYDGDTFDESKGEYRVKRDFYSKYYSYVGLTIGDYNPNTGDAFVENPNAIIAYLRPYNVGAFYTGFFSIDKWKQYFSDLRTTLFHDINHHTTWDATKTSVYFNIKAEEKDAMVFLTAKENKKVQFHNLCSILFDFMAEFIGEDNLIDPFVDYMFQTSRDKAIQVLKAFDEGNFTEVIDILGEDFIDFLKEEATTNGLSLITFKSIENYITGTHKAWFIAIGNSIQLRMDWVSADNFIIPIDFEGKNPPSQPVIVTPGHNVQLDNLSSTVLQWDASDFDGDDLSYDVYIGTWKLENMTKIASDFKYTSISVNLEENTRYLWRVIVSDGQYKSKSPTWEFVNGEITGEEGTGTPVDGEEPSTGGGGTIDEGEGEGGSENGNGGGGFPNHGIPQEGLVAYYPFNGNADDVSGNNLHGTAKNGVNFSASDRNNNSNKSIYIPNSSAYITIPNAPILQLQSHTIAAWVKRKVGVSTGGTGGVFNYGREKDYYALVANERRVRSYINFPSSSNNEHNYENNTLEDGEYHFIASSYDGINRKIWIDGELKSTMPFNEIINYNSTDNCYIGMNFPGGDDWFSGYIDEVIIYNRALSTSEIQTIYNH